MHEKPHNLPTVETASEAEHAPEPVSVERIKQSLEKHPHFKNIALVIGLVGMFGGKPGVAHAENELTIDQQHIATEADVDIRGYQTGNELGKKFTLEESVGERIGHVPVFNEKPVSVGSRKANYADGDSGVVQMRPGGQIDMSKMRAKRDRMRKMGGYGGNSNVSIGKIEVDGTVVDSGTSHSGRYQSEYSQ